MGKSLFIAEKPSVAQEFAKVFSKDEEMKKSEGYLESDSTIVTWALGHLVTMSYPEKYDPAYKKWSLDALPFLPDHFLYEVIPGSKKQFDIVSSLLKRPDVDVIYVCTDSGREGEYIYRLIEQEAKVTGKKRLRVWIDSQTEEEIRRGIREAKDLSEYDNLAASAYLRAIEDYLMGINFSRLLTLRYGKAISSYLKINRTVISVGRVMTCVLGMVVKREREIRSFVPTPYYRVVQSVSLKGVLLTGEFRAVDGSDWYQSPALYKENGFSREEDAEKLIKSLMPESVMPDGISDRTLTAKNGETALIDSLTKKKEKKNPPLLFNLAELQNDCSKRFRISPDQTLAIVQELYEKKLVTYPRTDARVLSSAVAKEIGKNISGLRGFEPVSGFAEEILSKGTYKDIGKTRYVNDKLITDHYAIIPTGQGLSAVKSLTGDKYGVYLTIVTRFLSIFYPPAEYQKVSLVTRMGKEKFFFSFKVLLSEGYYQVAGNPNEKKQKSNTPKEDSGEEKEEEFGSELLNLIGDLKTGSTLPVKSLAIKESETSPPKRYSSGSMILAMENAGQLIEDEDLRAQIKGSGIGTSATRADILKKLEKDGYLFLSRKTQILTPTLLGEMIYDVVHYSIPSLLNPELTASWEKGLTYVAEGSVTPEEYMEKLDDFIRTRCDRVKQTDNSAAMKPLFDRAAAVNKNLPKKSGGTKKYSGRYAKKKKTGTAAKK